ncbi:MAG TPA: hypothetical protein VMF08_17770 [Candidatus Sulfotelmatobacter sp.]|nr:hypothetical protein [Candidatus Sulfotelmatobacter sp.]
MELKVACDCGQKYKFDVEPVNGQMPFTVNCPVCGVDGTSAANQLLAQQVTTAAPALAPLPPLDPSPAPIGGLRINRPAPAPAPPPLLAASAPPPPPLGGRAPATIRPAMKAPVAKSKDFSMGLGVLGACLGSGVGGALVYAFFLWAHFRMPLSGTAIGVLAGYGARLLARGTDTTLGFITAGISLATIVSVFYFMYGDFFFFGILSIVICVGFAYRIPSG